MSDSPETLPIPAVSQQKDPKCTPKLNEALAKAQGKFIQPDKNKEVEVKKEGRLLYKTKYADLKNVIEAFRVPLSENGLSFTQKTISGERGWRLVLTLRHSSGEYDETSMPIQLDEPPQQVGSQLTYLKRYQAAAYFGIAADDDDDANGATGNEAEFKDKGANPNGSKVSQNQSQNQRPGNSVRSKGGPGINGPVAKPAEHAPPAKQPDPHVSSDDPQSFPPDDTEPAATAKAPPKEKEIDPKDPGEFVVLFGNKTTGKKIKQLGESDLKTMIKWCETELKKVPPVSNMSHLFQFTIEAKAFLKAMDIEV